MRLGWHRLLFLGVVSHGLLSSTACRKSPAPEPDIPPPNPVSNATPTPDISREPLEIHRASQEMALDGFQFGKNHLGWPCEAGAVSSTAYLDALIREGFLDPRTKEKLEAWSRVKISNLSDADPGETAFLEVWHTDGTIFIIRKDGQWSVFRDEQAASNFAATPPREPAWLP